jgi:hypothetical protein
MPMNMRWRIAIMSSPFTVIGTTRFSTTSVEMIPTFG